MLPNLCPEPARKRQRISLRDRFNQYFELLPADSPVLRREVYKLRFQVYCLETGFERVEDCRTAVETGRTIYLETDEYDHRSRFFLIRHRRSGIYAATVRMVLPDPHDPEASYPIEVHCELERPVTDPFIRRHLAEISRFAVSKTFKRRKGEAGTLTGINPQTDIYFQPDERRLLPHLTVGLFAGILRIARQEDITHCYAVMEPALLRLLRLFGVRFDTIGPDVEYHGLRRPCLAEIDQMLAGIERTDPDVWDLITDGGKYA